MRVQKKIASFFDSLAGVVTIAPDAVSVFLNAVLGGIYLHTEARVIERDGKI